MPKYRVYLQTVASTTIEVEADSKDDALEAALSEPMPRICAQCSGWGGSQNLELGDVWDISDNLTVEDAIQEVTEADA